MAKKEDSELASNRKAHHNYEIVETFEAGIALRGTEVKSLRAHGGNIQDAYILISGSSAILKNASIAPYSFGNIHNHEERRERQLLLHHREIQRLKDLSQLKGMTLIPLALYLKQGRVKVRIGCARGKQAHDKRDAIREKEQKRSIARALKGSRSE